MVGAGTRILVAPDKFKGSLTAIEAAKAIISGITSAIPDATCVALPFADGGDGTVDALIAAGASERTDRVTGPLGEPLIARWALQGGTAVIEMAEASGLRHVAPSPSVALAAHTAGTGELIRAALDAGADRIVVGIGGSAATDGGAGALRALGARFTDDDGDTVDGGGGDLSRITHVDLNALDPRLAGVDLVLCSDVANPFAGPDGAAYVFGPQKGAGTATIELLDAGLRQFAKVLREATGQDVIAEGWGGSGGGIAGGLWAACGAHGASGVDLIADLLGLDSVLESIDLVVVGEGSLDEQSLLGKTPVGVARRAAAAGVPAVAVVGRNSLGRDSLAHLNIHAITAAVDHAPTIRAALQDAARWTDVAARALFAENRLLFGLRASAPVGGAREAESAL